MLAAITGASAGIGATFARKLAAQGWDLLLIARRRDRLEQLAAELAEQHSIRADVLAADLADPAALEEVAERIQASPDLGLLVNNAGFGTNGYFWEADVRGQMQMHLLHVVATMRLTHAALSVLVPKARAGTGVINVSSVAAFGGAPQNVSYGATKAWMNAFTATLSVELSGRGSPVCVQALCPGFTRSEFHDVLQMDRSTIPAWLWTDADFVVDVSLREFQRGKLIVIPGVAYKVLSSFMRLMPGALVRKLSSAGVRRYRRSKVQPVPPG